MNHLRHKFNNNQPTRGLWMALPTVETARLAARQSLDWIAIDTEHSPVDVVTMSRIVAAVADANGPAPLVRVPAGTTTHIKYALDAGAWGIIAPMIQTRPEAQAIIRSAKFPPQGQRSFGSPLAPLTFSLTMPEYLQVANQETLVILQIESVKGVENAAEILSVPGVDMVFLGPIDLSISLGLGMFPGDNPTFKEAINHVLKIAKKQGIPAGIYCPNGKIAAQRIQQGFQLVNIASDFSLLLNGIQTQLKTSY